MNLFQSLCFRWRPAFRCAGFWESAQDIRQCAPLDHRAQFLFSLNQWKLPEIAVVQIQNVEGVEDWEAATKEQLVEKTPTFLIHTSDLAIDDRVPHLELPETVLKVFVRQTPETIDLLEAAKEWGRVLLMHSLSTGSGN